MQRFDLRLRVAGGAKGGQDRASDHCRVGNRARDLAHAERTIPRDCPPFLQRYYPLPSSSQPNFSRALRATSGLGVFEGANSSRQCQGLQALMRATEWVRSPDLRRSGGIAGSALESQEPRMNWIDSTGSVRVIIAQSM